MKRIGVGTWLTIGTLALAGVVWAVRLEGRTAALEQRHKESIEQVRADLSYIRGRLDAVLDSRRVAPTTGTRPEPAFRLNVRPRVGFSPADVEVRLHVEPGGRGRVVFVEVEGPRYHSSSKVNISRDPAAPTVQNPIWYRSIPSGEYVVSATLTDTACDGCSSRVVLARREQSIDIRPGAGERGQ